jgi:hypothetical protein
MTKQQEIAAFIDQHIAWPRVPYDCDPALDGMLHAHLGPGRPDAEQLAHELLDLADFHALRLGTWLNTTDGEIVAQGVEMVTPPLYRQDVQLLVAALRYAANLQHENAQRAGELALGAIALFGICGLILWSVGAGRPAG